jgi:integrase
MAYIRELSNGKYRILWRENATDDYGSPIKGQYTQRSETVPTAKAAERRRIDIEREIESGHDPSAKRDKAATALGVYAARYFKAAESRIGTVTLDGYRKLYQRHIADVFGSRPVGSILPSDVSSWFSDLLAGDSNRYVVGTDPDNPALAKRDPKTAKQALGVLRRIFNVAVLDAAIIANPALVKLTTSTKRDGRRRFRHCPLTPAQIATLSGYIANERHNPVYGLVVMFTGFTGLRAAEVAGLEIRDLTLSDIPGTAGAVRVERTKKKNGALWATEPTKTNESERTVPLEPWLADDLRDYLSAHTERENPTAPLFPGRLDLAQAKAQGRNVKDSADRFDWVSPVDLNNFYKRYMQPAEIACKLPAARFHDLRHSFAVNLLSATPPVDFKRVSKWLGHSTFTLTLDVYGDYINEDVSQPAGLSRPVAAEPSATNVVRIQRNA